MNIVVRSPNWIGDCIMCLPALRALKAHVPSDNIFLVTKHHLTDVFKNIPEIKEIIPIPGAPGVKESFEIAGKLKEYQFHRGILFTNSFSSALIFRQAGIKDLTGYNKDLRGLLLKNKLPFPYDSPKHHVYFYLDLVAHFLARPVYHSGHNRNTPQNIESDGQTDPCVYQDSPIILAEEKQHLISLSLEPAVDWSKPLIGISPSAAYGTAKQWLPERFSQLIQRILEANPDSRILLLGTAGEREKIDRIIATVSDPNPDQTPHHPRIHNLAGELTLRESLTAISLCRLFIANDSGLMHVAAALRIPLTAIFGPTRPHNTAPMQGPGRDITILHHGAPCAPCKHRDCPVDHACMKAVTVDEVFQSIKKRLH